MYIPFWIVIYRIQTCVSVNTNHLMASPKKKINHGFCQALMYVKLMSTQINYFTLLRRPVRPQVHHDIAP